MKPRVVPGVWWYTHGFIMADGCMRCQNGRLYLRVMSIDVDIIDKLAEVYLEEVSEYKDLRVNRKSTFYFDFHGEMVKEFYDSGVRPRKSVEWHEFDVPDEYFWDWLRGFTDGDGSVFNDVRGDLRVGWRFGVWQFAEWLRVKLEKFVGTQQKVQCDKQGFSLELANRMAREALKGIYGGAEIYLDRKYKKSLGALC